MICRYLGILLLGAGGTVRGADEVKQKEKPARPLRVLLFTSGANREYQFLRAMLLREPLAKQVELCIHLQNAPEKKPGAEVSQQVPPERLLTSFPDRLGKDVPDPAKPFLDLASYDVVIAFDPDWTRLTAEQLKHLRHWVEDRRGGLIFVAGPLHTNKLAHPDEHREKLKTIQALLPVQLADAALREGGLPSADHPRRLTILDAKTNVPFLKLGEGDKPLAFWSAFFGGDKEMPERGFFSCHPVDALKPAATVHATFVEEKLKMKNGAATPFLATIAAGKGRVAYIGSAEMWRLRVYREKAHERFWTRLMGYVAQSEPAK